MPTNETNETVMSTRKVASMKIETVMKMKKESPSAMVIVAMVKKLIRLTVDGVDASFIWRTRSMTWPAQIAAYTKEYVLTELMKVSSLGPRRCCRSGSEYSGRPLDSRTKPQSGEKINIENCIGGACGTGAPLGKRNSCSIWVNLVAPISGRSFRD